VYSHLNEDNRTSFGDLILAMFEPIPLMYPDIASMKVAFIVLKRPRLCTPHPVSPPPVDSALMYGLDEGTSVCLKIGVATSLPWTSNEIDSGLFGRIKEWLEVAETVK
jgi:hypothetical protein